MYNFKVSIHVYFNEFLSHRNKKCNTLFQDKEIKELSDRIEKQVTIMQRAYEKQLSLIEQAIDIEREAMVDHNNKRWEALYKQRDKEEVIQMDYKFEQVFCNSNNLLKFT